MGINYTETFTHNDNYTTKYLQQPDLANTIANITQSPKKQAHLNLKPIFLVLKMSSLQIMCTMKVQKIIISLN